MTSRSRPVTRVEVRSFLGKSEELSRCSGPSPKSEPKPLTVQAEKIVKLARRTAAEALPPTD